MYFSCKVFGCQSVSWSLKKQEASGELSRMLSQSTFYRFSPDFSNKPARLLLSTAKAAYFTPKILDDATNDLSTMARLDPASTKEFGATVCSTGEHFQSVPDFPFDYLT